MVPAYKAGRRFEAMEESMTVREPATDLPEEMGTYRPISPAAAVSVVAGLLAWLAGRVGL